MRDRDELTGVRKSGYNSGYDRIIMNPPCDAEHVQHAYSLLKPGGRLVAIMGEGVFYGQDKKAVAFREWLDEVGGTSEKLEEGTFLDPSLPVNTATNARLVVIDRPLGDASSYQTFDTDAQYQIDNDLPAMADIGTIGEWNKEPGYSPIPTKDLVKVFKAFSTMRESGIPKWALSQIKQVTGSIYKDGRRAGFNPQAGRLAIGKNLFSEEESEFRLVISHEIGHAMDFMPYDGKVLATLSSHPDMASVLNESQNAYDSGLYPDVLWYPLDSTDFPGCSGCSEAPRGLCNHCFALCR